MGGLYRLSRPQGRVSFDWMMIVVALIAGALLAGAVIRTETAGQPGGAFGAQIGGLRALAPNETLVLFEDYSFDAGGWTGTGIEDDGPGLGSIIGPVAGDQPLSRDIDLPDGTVRVVLSFDLIAIDDWALQPLTIAVNGNPVLIRSFSTRPDLAEAQTTDARPADGIVVGVVERSPVVERGYAAGTPALFDQVLRVHIAVDTPGATLTLSISRGPTEIDSGDAEAEAGEAPAWALDNLSVVARSLEAPTPQG